MKFDRTKNSIRIFAFGLLYNILITLLPFATRTIIVYKLGTEYLGLSSLFTSVISMLNMSNLGIASAVTFCMYKPVAEEDNEAICALLGFLRKMYRIIGLFILVCGIAIIPFLKFFIKGECPADINIYVLYIIYLMNTVFSYLTFAYKNVLLEAYQKGDIIHKIQMLVEMIKYGLQIIILLVFRNYYWFAAMLPITALMTNVLIERRSKKEYPKLQPAGSLSREYTNIIKQKVVALSLHSITSTLINSIDSIIISASIGLTAIALYGNYTYISSAVLSILLIAYKAIKSAIGNVLVTESSEYSTNVFNGLQFLSTWISAWCTVCLICLFQPFMDIWLGTEYLLSNAVVILIGLYFYANTQRQFLTITYIGSAGLWNKTLFRQIIATAVNLLLDVILVRKFGIEGVVFASLFSYAVISLPLDIYVVYQDIIHADARIGFKKMFSGYIYLGILCIVTYVSCRVIPVKGMLGFFIKMIICCVVPNACFILMNYTKKEFKFVIEHLQSLMPNKN